ncbi:MAG: TIGR01777 family oxidoreductase [Lautropia sp.]|nr:TIGR01777 family oxidoreductase [Lautropia sp.]
MPEAAPTLPSEHPVPHRPTVMLLGGSGFIGRHLAADYADRGWRVLIITRRPDDSRTELGERFEYFRSLHHFDPSIWVDLVINLTGASVGDGRWTARRKQLLLDSRLEPTRALADWLKTTSYKPQRVIQASAVGYYGNGSQTGWQKVLDENGPPQPTVFVSELCQQWEALAQQMQTDTGIPVTICRLGVVLGHGGGILPQLLKPVSMGVGRIGPGNQPLPWIHLDDVISAIRFVAERPTDPAWQIYNLVAPDLTTQLSFAETAARLTHQRLRLTMPGLAMRLAMGEQADLVLDGQFIKPARLLAEGFTFQYPDVEEALQNLLQK